MAGVAGKAVSLTSADIRETALLTAACAAGAVVAPALPMVGLPLCALALGALVFRGRVFSVITSVLAAALIAGMFRSVDALAIGFACMAIALAARRLRTADPYAVGLIMAPVLGAAFAAAEFLWARMQGMTITEYLTDAAREASVLLGTTGSVGGVAVDELAQTMVRFAPAVYLLLGVVAAVPVMVALVWAARRVGVSIHPVPRLAEVDLTPHVLWVLIVAIAAMAAGRVWGGEQGLIWAVGANLLMVVRVAMTVQGLAVIAAALGSMGAAGPVFGLGIVLALLIDSATWMVSLVGLLDFWVNFRKLDRGLSPTQPEGPPLGH